ncbi:recombinase family protein [Acetatifactor aquisgranensis]|uniref:recombinase family protein n=1 Tax=Acetatifactor aquisgranensis TaxID=2941233 RepID=UPI00203BD515|nr:recombinase family protein [Acetatifactor aquisgranensis]
MGFTEKSNCIKDRVYIDMHLAGNGSQKIKKQLEKDGDLTAMGKSLWHYATISHILKNRLCCGEPKEGKGLRRLL